MTAIAMCSCGTKRPNSSTKYLPVEANEEGVCLTCGHYVVWQSKYQLYPKSTLGIGGYRPVANARNYAMGWDTTRIANYYSDCPFEIISNKELPGKKFRNSRLQRKKE
ncbi:MAG: hypothetical protein Unbinned8261contig1001_29 [Prokaryotic dsDNA virus sp.]|nr:MAG: hypothetical protein Unbinned8261contig1001_29 [Prokaryotic dsDNA virus sp.]